MTQFRSVLVLSVCQIAGFMAPLLPLTALAGPALSDTSSASGVKAAASTGERVYVKWCAECHASELGPGTHSLERKYKGQVPAILDKRPGIPAALVEYTVRHGIVFMPPFRKTEISNSELTSLATYLSSVGADPANKKAELAQ